MSAGLSKIFGCLFISCVLFLASACSQQAGTAGADSMAGQEDAQEGQQKSTEGQGITGAAVSGDGKDDGVECYSDSECGEVVTKEPYCFQGSVVTPESVPECHNAGTVDSYCRTESNDRVELCSPSEEFCRDGQCLVIAEEPCEDTDGGRDYSTQGKVTDALKERLWDQCAEDEKTLYERYCSHGDYGKVMTEEHRCSGKCSGGECVEKD